MIAVTLSKEQWALVIYSLRGGRRDEVKDGLAAEIQAQAFADEQEGR